MRIIKMGIDTKRVYTNPMCACIGYFDGMHKGHQQFAIRLKCLKDYIVNLH